MPFNVLDGKGRHIGIVKDSFPRYLYPVYFNVFLAAFTDYKIEDISFDIARIKNFVAGAYNCKSIFGRINENILKERLKSRFGTEICGDTDDNYNNLLKLALLKNLYDCDIKKFSNFDSIKDGIKGYFLLDIDKVRFVNNSIIVEENMDYINFDEVYESRPIFGKIASHPVLYYKNEDMDKWVLRGEEVTRTLDRTHLNMTRVEISSGNFSKIIDFPVHIKAKIGDSIQMYLSNREVRKIFCDGMVYIY